MNHLKRNQVNLKTQWTTHRRQRLKKTPAKVSAKKRTKKSDLKDSDEEKKGNAKNLNKSSDKTDVFFFSFTNFYKNEQNL